MGGGKRDERREDVHRVLVEQTRELLCLHDLDGSFVFLSPSVQEALGYDPEALVGEDPLDLVHEDDVERVRSMLRAVMEGRETPALTARFLRRDGTPVWLETQARVLRDERGAITRMVTNSRDVSSRMEVEATLASVIAALDDLVFLFDEDGRFREYHQPRGHRGLYAPPEDFVGRHFADTLPPQVSTPLAAALERAALDAGTHDFEYEIPIEGSPRRFHAKVTPMLGEGGDTRGFVGVVRDVTDRRAAEEQRVALIRAEEHAERLEGLSVLARGAAHEFNNLLTTIQGSIDLAHREIEGHPQARADLEDALAASARAAEITKRLLRYSGRSISAWEVLDPGEVARRVAGELTPAAEGHGLSVDVAPETPSIRADPELVQAAVRHVLLNALEALPADGPGQVSLRVESRRFDAGTLDRSRVPPVARPGSFVVFEVSDTGEGIAAHLLPRIFTPFVSTRGLGRGIGLAEVAGIVRCHEGAALVDQPSDRGTRVSLLFPVAS